MENHVGQGSPRGVFLTEYSKPNMSSSPAKFPESFPETGWLLFVQLAITSTAVGVRS